MFVVLLNLLESLPPDVTPTIPTCLEENARRHAAWQGCKVVFVFEDTPNDEKWMIFGHF